MKTLIRELEELIWSNVEHAREQRTEYPKQKDYYDGMLFAYGQMLNSMYYPQQEKEVINQSFVKSDWYEELSKYRYNIKE
jgi:hypothetical protein